MILINRMSIFLRSPNIVKIKYLSTMDITKENLCKLLNISDIKAEYMCLKHPVIRKLNTERMESVIEALRELGFGYKVLVQEPLLFSILPITLKYRYQVLEECGIKTVSPEHIISYLEIVKQKSIGDLRSSQIMNPFINVENRLASYLTQWPTSLTTLIYGDVDEMTLYNLRLKIIQRYLELVLDLTKEEFCRAVEIYPTIKHRPLQVINETLNILQSVIMMPNHKIKNNMYLVHVDSENLKKIIYKIHSIGGIDVKEVIRLRPKLATKSYSSIMETKRVLKEYGITNEAQVRCLDIYTLGPKTVKERLEEAKNIPEFNTFLSHPRFLKMIHYKNTAIKRMNNLYNSNKKCLSLNILSGSSAHFDIFEKAPGDRLGKGKDLVFCISQSLGKAYNTSDIRKLLQRHPFWINIPLVQVKYVYQKLSSHFTNNDIYKNCSILLYPWNKINEILNILDKKVKLNKEQHLPDWLDLNKLDKSKKLSLVLYLLEKHHYFTGNGVWLEDKNKVLNDISEISSKSKNEIQQ